MEPAAKENLNLQQLKAWLDTCDTLERWRQTPPEELKDRIRLIHETEGILQYALAVALRAEPQKAYNMTLKEIEDRLAEVRAEYIQLQEVLKDVKPPSACPAAAVRVSSSSREDVAVAPFFCAMQTQQPGQVFVTRKRKLNSVPYFIIFDLFVYIIYILYKTKAENGWLMLSYYRVEL